MYIMFIQLIVAWELSIKGVYFHLQYWFNYIVVGSCQAFHPVPWYGLGAHSISSSCFTQVRLYVSLLFGITVEYVRMF